jgi:hypothetical protein
MQKPYTSGKPSGTVKAVSQGRIKSITGPSIPKGSGAQTTGLDIVARSPYGR